MTPTPQEHASARDEMLPTEELGDIVEDGERIVISGMSGLFPECHSVKDLSNILYNKESPITSENLRWSFKHPELSNYTGMVPDVDKFDAQFFTVYYRLGHYMDPMSRKMLEQTYQAIYDAGISPAHIAGKKVAVYIGSSFSDTEKNGFFDSVSKSGLGIVGSSKTMFANRISYWLDAKGPSIAIDDADASSMAALEQAYLSIKRGECEAAIVGGANLCLHPQGTIHHGRLAGTVPKDGKTKSFAENSDGYVLSDAISVMYLQKAKNAKRVYAELLHVKNEFTSIVTDDTGPVFGHNSDVQTTADFIKQFYKEANVSPHAVEYLEGYGTGIPDADKSELEAIEKAYCEDRVDPLLLGSVTSNIGLTEAASGMAAITKVLLGYHTGQLAANLHCAQPRQDIAAIKDGRIQIVTDHQKFQRTYTAINAMSMIGINSHALLHGHYKPKDLSRYKSSIPQLITISARQEESINKIFNDLKSRSLDAEELALLRNIHEKSISGHLGRGYAILDTSEDLSTVSISEKAEYFDDARRPLWFVYSGMGSQWAGMGTQLMRIPIFAAAIEKCHNILKPKGLDIEHIITSPDKTTFDNILHSFVGIAAVQIGLTDILLALGLKPEGIIGHSVGELGCAYADGCLSAEEMILCAYSRGLVSLQTKLIRGSMAAVGLGYEEIAQLCPPEIDVACHNGPDSSTISGPADVMKEFVADLTSKGVFAKEVPCSNIAYHSRYIADAGAGLLKYLKEVIKTPKARSARWLSTSVPQKKWGEESAKLCSAEYHTNNLLSPVLFDETSRLLPSNAVLVEVAPHGLLQAILKRAMPVDCKHVPLTRRGHKDNALFLLQALGDLYMHGYNPNLQALYPKVQFPVSTGTPMLSHLVEWVHSENWYVTSFREAKLMVASACQFVKSIHDDEYSYLRGHVVREKMCYPHAAALVAAWDLISMHSGFVKRQKNVEFRDVQLYAQPLLHDQRPLTLSIDLQRGTGKFEVTNHNTLVATGFIYINLIDATGDSKKYIDGNKQMDLSSQDIYQLFRDRDYAYSGEFQSIEAVNGSFDKAAVEWSGNWVTFIDGLLQLNTLRQPHDGVTLPTQIRRMLINMDEHGRDHVYQLNNKNVMLAQVTPVYDIIRSGGILIQDMKYRNLPCLRTPSLNLAVTGGENQIDSKAAPMKNTVTLQCGQPGDLKSLHWREGPQTGQAGVTIKVHYAGLTVTDVQKASGIHARESETFGMDFSGVTESGEQVMGLISSGAASNTVRAQPELLWPVPAYWSLEDAATVPLAYAHAFYCLKIRVSMEPGMKILVHGGAGALGQAAIAVALANQCEVFTTVGNLRKKKFLSKLYPQLADGHIFNSRDISFADDILIATNGEGCNIVLTCMKGEFKNVSFKCCSFSGFVVDTYKIQNNENYVYGMAYLMRQRAYISADFSSIFEHQNKDELLLLQSMVNEGIKLGFVRPLTRVAYAPSDVSRAFRLLGSSQHCGRVLLRMQDTVSEINKRFTCESGQSNLVFCDGGSLGIQIANMLITRGARKLYIHSTNVTPYQEHKIKSWKNLGIKVLLSTGENKATSILNDANASGAVEGIYVVSSSIPEGKAQDDLTTKLQTLDSASRLLCPQLKHFAVISTVGAVGQDTCLSRAKCGYPITNLDLSGLSEDQKQNRYAVNAVELAVNAASPLQVAKISRVESSGLLEEIASLADITIPQNANPETTLREFGLADVKIPLIHSLLYIHYNLYLNENHISLLTPAGIQELVEITTEAVAENVTGLKALFSQIEGDELETTTSLIRLQTLNRDITLTQSEFDGNSKHLCIVPGLEGNHERFRALCERLKLPALALQPGLDRPNETIRETAERYTEILIDQTNIQNNFYLLGYESGVLVALEMAAILEDHGLTGTVFCVGCTPEGFQTALEENLSEFKTEEELANAMIRHMVSLTADIDSSTLDKPLSSSNTFSEKLDACGRVLVGQLKHSAQYTRSYIQAAFTRVQIVRGYVAPVRALRSQLVLLQASQTQGPAAALGLQKHSQLPIIVQQLRSPLSHISQDMECASIINKNLDPELQSAFEQKNTCDTY